MMQIRDAHRKDFETIVDLNALEVQQTSPMDLERLYLLHDLSSYHKVATMDGHVAGFLLAFREGSPYRNHNYQWFASRYARFLYVDRIVISQKFKGVKIGSALYRNLIGFAQATNVKFVVCEYYIEPLNLPSSVFHGRFGFKEVGTQRTDDSSRLVSLQELEI